MRTRYPHSRQAQAPGFARTCSTATHKNGSINPTHNMLLTEALQIDTNNLNRRHMMVVSKDTRDDDIELAYDEQTEDRRDGAAKSPRVEDQRIKADTDTTRMEVVSTLAKEAQMPVIESYKKPKQNAFKILKKSLLKRVSRKKNKVDRVMIDDARDELIDNNGFKPVDDARDEFVVDESVDDTWEEEEDRSSLVIDFNDWFTTPQFEEESRESALVTVEEVEEEDDESCEESITSEINSVDSEKMKERTPSISSGHSSRSGRSTPPVALILESWGDESMNDCLDNKQTEPPVVEVEDDETKNMEPFPARVLGQGLDLKRFNSSPLTAFSRQRSNPISTFNSMIMGKQEREELIKLIKFNAQLEKKKAELKRQQIELDKEMLDRYGSDDSTEFSTDGSSDYSASLANSNESGSSKETHESYDGESWTSFFHDEQSDTDNTSFMNNIFGSFLCSCGEKEKKTYNNMLPMV